MRGLGTISTTSQMLACWGVSIAMPITAAFTAMTKTMPTSIAWEKGGIHLYPTLPLYHQCISMYHIQNLWSKISRGPFTSFTGFLIPCGYIMAPTMAWPCHSMSPKCLLNECTSLALIKLCLWPSVIDRSGVTIASGKKMEKNIWPTTSHAGDIRYQGIS